jgi:hypothetical protein
MIVSIIVEFIIWFDDLLINIFCQGFLNRQNFFLWKELIPHPSDETLQGSNRDKRPLPARPTQPVLY